MPEVEAALLEVFRRQPRLGHRKAKVLVNRLLSALDRLVVALGVPMTQSSRAIGG